MITPEPATTPKSPDPSAYGESLRLLARLLVRAYLAEQEATGNKDGERPCAARDPE